MNLIKRFQAYAEAVAASHQSIREDMYPEKKTYTNEVYGEEFDWELKVEVYSPTRSYSSSHNLESCTPTGRWKVVQYQSMHYDLFIEVVYQECGKTCRAFKEESMLTIVCKPNETINECACK